MTPLASPTQTTSREHVATGLPLGAHIYSRDGQRLSKVKEVRERCFLVDVRFAFDYWLDIRCVAAVRNGDVYLAVDKRHVAHYLVDIDCPGDLEELGPAADGWATLAFNRVRA